MADAGTEHAWQAGDPAAFDALVREHGASVLGFALRRCRDRATAEDLAQETFLRAWRSRGSFRGESSERAWLLVIAANVARDHERALRRRVRTGPLEVDRAEPGADPAARVEHADAIDRLRGALAGLPEQHREVFLLRERDGLTYKEIAAVVGCPIGTVMSSLARARERLLAAVNT